ncbi:unnamed protein product [Owenia fusiformis]|uniref:TNFR-Cys domain-containing protein n=1 Tax=Owenia fusiformis TaxID=6347 RepID=A0A8S4NAX9_OWEFU|nr:unnamed protein product [Owenia fusiformis]
MRSHVPISITGSASIPTRPTPTWAAIIAFLVIGCANTVKSRKSMLLETPCKIGKEYKVVAIDGRIHCKSCSHCASGECISTHCYEYRDTQCRSVGPNEFIEGEVCYPCSDCGSKREVLQGCSRDSDTQCGGCVLGYQWDFMLEECLPDPQSKAAKGHHLADQSFRLHINKEDLTTHPESQDNVTFDLFDDVSKYDPDQENGMIIFLTITLVAIVRYSMATGTHIQGLRTKVDRYATKIPDM